jgi:hypothetical protein
LKEDDDDDDLMLMEMSWTTTLFAASVGAKRHLAKPRKCWF